MALLEYIKNQLLFKESVTLPGLGSFEIRKSASYIQGKKIVPPTAKIVFNTEKSLDDGSLAKSIAAAEDISLDEAGQKVLEYIDEILFALNKGEGYVFQGFGKLYRDSDNVFRFDKDPGYQIEFESYGLESFELEPIEDILLEEKTPEPDQRLENKANQVEERDSKKAVKSKDKMSLSGDNITKKSETHAVPAEAVEEVLKASPPSENKNNRNIFWILTGAVIVVLISFVLIRMGTNLLDGPGISFFKTGQNDKQEVFPEDEKWSPESTMDSELGAVIDSMTLQENAMTIQETSEPKAKILAETLEYKEYHIIAGSFKDKVNAGILQQKLTEKGYPALLIQQGDQLYRVSALSFKNKEQGLKALSQFKQKTKINAAWLLGLK